MSSQLTDATVTHRDKRGSIARVAPPVLSHSPGPCAAFCSIPSSLLGHQATHGGRPCTFPSVDSLPLNQRLARGSPPVGARVHTGHPDVSEVSDSEPEREERRKREREGRKRRKKHHPPLQCHTDVIELTDSQEPILTQPTSQPSQVPPTTQSIISIHGMLHLLSDRIVSTDASVQMTAPSPYLTMVVT